MMIRTIFAKYCGRAFSTMASSPLSSSVKHGWKEQKSLGLCAAFLSGFGAHVFLNLHKRREHWHKIDRMYDEAIERSEELHARSVQFHRATKGALSAIRKHKSTS